MPSRAMGSLPHCLSLPLYSAFLLPPPSFFPMVFLSPRNLSLDLVGCGVLQDECWPQLGVIFSGSVSMVIGLTQPLSLAIPNSWEKWAIGSVSVRCLPCCPISCAGEERVSWHMESDASWHIHPSLFGGAGRLAEDLWFGVFFFSVNPQGRSRVPQCSGQAFRTPAAGTWSLFDSQIIGPLKMRNSCQY